MNKQKPPIGVSPEYIYEAQCNTNRINEILDKMIEYSKYGYLIPSVWVYELQKRINNEGKI